MINDIDSCIVVWCQRKGVLSAVFQQGKTKESQMQL